MSVLTYSDLLAQFLPQDSDCPRCCIPNPQDRRRCSRCSLDVCIDCLHEDASQGTALCTVCDVVVNGGLSRQPPALSLLAPVTQRRLLYRDDVLLDGDGTGEADNEGSPRARKKRHTQPWVPCEPNAHDVSHTFGRNREEVLQQVKYTDHRMELVVIGADAPGTTGAKLFNVLPRNQVYNFIHSCDPLYRNFYVLPDPDVPTDLSLDIDVNVEREPGMEGKGYDIVDSILSAVQTGFERLFDCTIGRVLVLDATRPEKISFHLHIQAIKVVSGAGEDGSPPPEQQHYVFQTMHSARRFFAWIKSNITAPHLQFADFNSFNRWQPCRLPLCWKRGSDPKVTSLRFLSLPQIPQLQRWHRVCCTALVPNTGNTDSERVWFDIALITQPEVRAFLQTAILAQDNNNSNVVVGPQNESLWFTQQLLPVLPSNVEYTAILDFIISFSPQYSSVHNVTINYQGGNPRVYYARQRQSKYCCILNRSHRDTFGEFLFYYNVIRYKCWSNDCCHISSIKLCDTPEALRAIILPSLPPDELERRGYPQSDQPSANVNVSAGNVDVGPPTAPTV